MAILKVVNKNKKYHDKNSKKDLINYILNKDKAKSGYVGSKGFFTNNYAEEMQKTSENFNKTNGVQARHFVISFTPKEVCEPDVAYAIGDEICDFLGAQYQTVFAVHENTDDLHFHIVSNTVSYIDGHKYYGTKKEFYDFRKHIDTIFNEYGIKPIKYKANKIII